MNKKQLKALIKQRTSIIDRLTEGLDSDVKDAEKQLLKTVTEDFLDKLDVTDGNIADTIRNKRMLSVLDKVFTEFSNSQGVQLANSIVTGVQEIFQFNTDYFSNFAIETTLIPINNQVQATLNGWLGIDNDGSVKENGYLSNLIKDSTVSNQIKDIMVRQVVSGAGMAEAKQTIKDAIVGDPENLGALQKHYKSFVNDIYSQVDRTASSIVANKLGLDYAIYEGGIIKTTREFCRERNGKVFTRAEIQEFNPPEAQPDYDPVVDLGGWNCRHHLNWISYTLAIIFRPDLKQAA